MRPALALALLLWGLATPAAAFDHLLYTFDAVDTSTTAALRLYTDAPLKAPRLELTGGPAPRVVDGVARAIPDAGRWVYRFSLRGLRPGVVYTARVLDGDQPRFGPRRLSTLDPARPRLRVVAGGDISPSPVAAEMWKAAAAERPDLIVLGGDLAYANGRPDLAPLWDRLFAQQRAAFGQLPLVPVIAAIGNHEVQGGIGGSPEKAPFWFALFGDPEKPTFYERALPHARLLVLDTAHVARHEAQLGFIEAALDQPRAPGDWALATYHVPLFPSVRPMFDALSTAGRRFWLPAFAKGLDLALENHDHALKRATHEGVLFLGDGCWGRDPRFALGGDYLEAWSSVNHVWVLEIEPGVIRARAIDERGRVLDKATLFRPLRPPAAPLSE